MKIQFTGRHSMEVTPALRDFTMEKFTRLSKYVNKMTQVHVTFDVDNGKARQMADAVLHIPNNEIHARAESEDMYKTIDLLVDKLTRQLNKHKERASTHR